MALYTLGINHKTAPLAVRETVSFGPEQVLEALPMLGQQEVVEELVILSTCNRTEIYCSLSKNNPDHVLEWLSEYHQVGLTELKKAVYFHRDEEAARHMMRVASGLDSMVLGEPQIFGQLKEAYIKARNLGVVGGNLDRLFQHTFSVAKRVRTETAIGENPVSVAFAAVGMASRIFSDLSKSTALLIGAGETIELAARHLFQSGVRSLIVANRTLAKARHLASTFHGSAIGLSDIPDYLQRADIVIASTASTLPILGKGAVELALKKRRHRAMFMVDLAVPRDIEEQVDDLDDVYLYTVDDLRSVINDNLKSRKDAAADAEKLIATGAAEFMYHLRALDSVSMLKTFRDQVERVRDEEVNKALKSLQKGRQPEEVIRVLAHGLSNKIIHHPTVQVRKASAEGRAEVSGWLRDLFQLPDDQTPD